MRKWTNHTCCYHGEQSMTEKPLCASSPGVFSKSAAHPFSWSFLHHRWMLFSSFGDKNESCWFFRWTALKISWPLSLMVKGRVLISAVIYYFLKVEQNEMKGKIPQITAHLSYITLSWWCSHQTLRLPLHSATHEWHLDFLIPSCAALSKGLKIIGIKEC